MEALFVVDNELARGVNVRSLIAQQMSEPHAGVTRDTTRCRWICHAAEALYIFFRARIEQLESQ